MISAETKRRSPTTRRVLREEIREHVVDEILSGRLWPGTRIVEKRLATQLGVSQTPVREALRDLALFGFVVYSPYCGTYVREISTADVLKGYPVRAALESVAAREAALVMTDDTFSQLEACIEAMRIAADADDHRAHVDADFAFHHRVVKAAGNVMLEQVWESMRLATTTVVTHAMLQLTRRSLSEIGQRHVSVLEALRSRDPQLAEVVMRRHIEEPGEWIREATRRDTPRGADRRAPAVAAAGIGEV